MGHAKWIVEFYIKSNNKRCPTADLLSGLTKQDIYSIRRSMDQLAEHGNKLVDGKHAKFIGDGIYELRVRTNQGHFRFFFFFFDGTKIVITHGYSKKTRTLDPNEIQKAKEYKKDYFTRHER